MGRSERRMASKKKRVAAASADPATLRAYGSISRQGRGDIFDQRGGHEAEDENREGHERPDTSLRVNGLPAVEQHGMAETKEQGQRGPHVPAWPVIVRQRNEAQDGEQGDAAVILAGK